MKSHFRNNMLIILLATILCNCSSYKKAFYKGHGDVEQARMNVILDFTKTYQTPNGHIKE